MTASWVRRLTWSKFGIAVSVGLIIFGTLVAVLPHHQTSVPPPMPIPGGRPGGVGVGASARASTAQQVAAQQVAEQFVTACDTTDPSHPTGDIAAETELAPALAVPHAVTWPPAWTAEDRHTTVALDPPGQPVTEPGGQVAVIVTGTMLITSGTVASAVGPSETVPVTEKVTLALAPAGSGSSGWLVTGVEVGA